MERTEKERETHMGGGVAPTSKQQPQSHVVLYWGQEPRERRGEERRGEEAKDRTGQDQGGRRRGRGEEAQETPKEESRRRDAMWKTGKIINITINIINRAVGEKEKRRRQERTRECWFGRYRSRISRE